MLGFVSGANWASPGDREDFLKGLDAPALEVWIDNYCRAHPLERFSDSVDALVKELRTKALRR